MKENDPIKRACELPWPLFLRFLGHARVAHGSFIEGHTSDERIVILTGLIASYQIGLAEIENAIDKVRPPAICPPVESPEGNSVDGEMAVKHADLFLRAIENMDTTLTALYKLAFRKW